MDYIKQDATLLTTIRTTLLTRNTIMSRLGRLTYDDATFIGIVLEGFCYGEIFCSACDNQLFLFRIVFCCVCYLYAMSCIQKTRYQQEKHPSLCSLYMLSTATIALDVTRCVIVSKTCIRHNNFSL